MTFRDPLLDTLAAACAERPTGEKWVLLESLSQGRLLGERLAKEGSPWLNLRFTTPRALAQEAAAPEMARQGILPMHPAMGPALVNALLHQDLGKGRPYFRRLAGFPGLPKALHSALSTLRLAGIRPRDLKDQCFVSPDKAAELRALLEGYEKALESRKLADIAATLTLALPLLKTLGGERLLLVDAAVPWTALEEKLIQAIPGERRWLPIPAPAGLQVPRRLQGRPAKPPAGAQSDAERLVWLFAPEQAPPVLNDNTLEMFHAAGHDAEVHEALRRALSEGLRFDQVELVCASPEPYAGLVRDTAARLGIPVTLADGISAVHTRPGRALAAFCLWAEEGFPAGRLIRLLQSGDMDTGLEPAAAQAARILLAAAPAGGRTAAAASLHAYAVRRQSRAEAARAEGDEEGERHGQAEADRAQRLAVFLRFLTGLVPEGEALEPAAVFQGCARFLDRHVRPGEEADKGALEEILAGLKALGEIPSPSASLSSLLRQVLELVEGIRVRREEPRPGALHLAPLASTGRSGRPRTFVLGLDQGALPGLTREHPVLLDEEIRRLGGGLPTGEDRASEALFLNAGRLGLAGGKTTLSYAARDLREDRELYPASVLLQAHRLERPERPDLAYGDLLRRLGPPVTRVPAFPQEALDASGWWLASLRDAGEQARTGVLEVFPDLASGSRAEDRRALPAFSAHDGHAPSAAGAADPRLNGLPVSASALEQMAECGFRFFLKRLLRLDPPPDAEGGDRWLDPMTRGVVLHEVYAAFLRALRREGARPDPARDAKRILQLGQEALDRIREILPPPSRHLEALEVEALQRDLLHFLKKEATEKDRTPLGLEVGFGLGPSDLEPLDSPEPVGLDLGEGMRFLLKGQIDRIDRLGTGPGHEVVDYKTGRPWGRGRRRAHLAGGAQLQHALYALAAEQLLRRADPKAVVTTASYLFPTVRGGWRRIARPRGEDAALREVLARLMDLAAAGVFAQTEDPGTCGRCEFRKACGEEPWKIGKLKRGGGDPLLDPVRALDASAEAERESA